MPIDPDESALRAACRAMHTSHDVQPTPETCVCGAIAGAPSPACNALRALVQDRARLRRVVEALRNYHVALFDVPPARLEQYLQEHGWRVVNRDEVVRVWSWDDGVRTERVTVADAPTAQRPVDHLRDALVVLESIEQRSRHEILADLLPDD